MLSAALPPPAERQALIAQARTALLSQGQVPAALGIEPWIVRSWQRCLALGRAPGQRVAFDLVSVAMLRNVAEQHRHLLQAARPVLAHLTRAIAGMHYFAILTDTRGAELRRIAFPFDDDKTPLKPDWMFFGGLLYKKAP